MVAAASSLATIPDTLIACVLSGTAARQCLTPQTGILLSEEGELPLPGSAPSHIP